jgi:quercetin dioxygenase-like cupin family protein
MILENLRAHMKFESERFGRSVVLSSDTAVLFLYSFQAGQAMTDHTHPFSNEFLQVIQGEATITVDVETVLAKPGEVIFVPREFVHSIHNHTDRPLVVSSFMSPKP